MNQILLNRKTIRANEKKKKIYKLKFIVSLSILITLIIIYIFLKVNLLKDNDAKDILKTINTFDQEVDEIINISNQDDKNDNQDHEQESNQDEDEYEEDEYEIEESSENQENDNSSNSSKKINTNTRANNSSSTTNTNNISNNSGSTASVTTASGNSYLTNLTITIPEIGVNLPILIPNSNSITDVEKALKSSCVKFWGPEINEVGNYCIVGHNYRNTKFFSKVPNLDIGSLVQINDLNGNCYNYYVYDKYTVDSNDINCLDQRTNGKHIVTLITCTNDSKQRYIIKCQLG